METDGRLDKPIGTKESQILQAKPVKPLAIKIEEQKKGDKIIGDKVVIVCKHPDREDPIEISSVSYLKAKQIKNSGLWYNEDEDGNIAKQSALADFMRYLKIESLKDITKLESVQTELDEKNYLCFKAY